MSIEIKYVFFLITYKVKQSDFSETGGVLKSKDRLREKRDEYESEIHGHSVVSLIHSMH